MPGDVNNDQFLTYREAISLFATKEDVRVVAQNVADLKMTVQNLVPRQEQELHWDIDEKWREDVNRTLQRLTSNQLPGYVVPVIALLVTLFTVFFHH